MNLLIQQIHSFNSRSLFEGFHHPGKQTVCYRLCSPLFSFPLGGQLLKVFAPTVQIFPLTLFGRFHCLRKQTKLLKLVFFVEMMKKVEVLICLITLGSLVSV